MVLALQLCDQVSLAGFGYDMRHPGARLHYYETLRMDAMKGQVREPRRVAGGGGGREGNFSEKGLGTTFVSGPHFEVHV